MMLENLRFERVTLDALHDLRTMQVTELRGHVQESIEEGIVIHNADCIRICWRDEAVGYACIGTAGVDRLIILEYFVIDRFRRHATSILRQLTTVSGVTGWLVSTQDALALPIMLDLGLPYSIDAYILATRTEGDRAVFVEGASFSAASAGELSEVYRLALQDGFYTGGGFDSLRQRWEHGELYSLRRYGRLIGVGFVSPLPRTPEYADVAMIIEQSERQRGWGAELVKALIATCRSLGLVPTAVCSADNHASRRTLERAGFWLAGCLLLCSLHPLRCDMDRRD